jgi:hypothetical protein
MLQGWLARMCRFTYRLLTEDGLSNILFRNQCLVYMTSMSKETLWLCVLVLDVAWVGWAWVTIYMGLIVCVRTVMQF